MTAKRGDAGHQSPGSRRAARRTWRSVGPSRWQNLSPASWLSKRPQGPARRASELVAGFAIAAAAGGALAGAHPTGTPVLDPLYSAALAAAITLVASRSSREVWLVVSAVAVVMSRSWLLLPAFGALVLAFASVYEHRSRRRVGAAVGALVSQLVLRWPPVLFHGLTALVATVIVVLLVMSAYRRSSRRVKRSMAWVAGGVVAVLVLLALPVSIEALLARSEVTHGEHAAESALTQVEDGYSSAGKENLNTAVSDFTGASDRLSAWWTTLGRAVPVVAQQRRTLVVSSAVALRVSLVARSEADDLNYHTLNYHNGQIDLSRLEAMGSPMNTLNSELGLATSQLDSVRSAWLLSPVSSRFALLQRDLSRARSNTSLAAKAIRVLPAMLGADGPRHYFVAFMTPAEQRGLDGFIGSYGELTALDGKISLTASGPILNLESAGVPPSQRVLSGPADYLDRYGKFDPAQFPQDSTYSPDLPTVDQVISQLYPQEGGDQLDGVLAIDPYGMASLLELTGPIHVAGLPVPLDSANAARVLITDQYTIYDNGQPGSDLTRHDFLQDALHIAFQDLVNGSLPGPRTLSRDLEPAVRQGRISFWSNHAEDQGLIDSIGLGGRFPEAGGGDLLATTTQAAGNNKIDSYLHESMSDDVTYDPSSGEVDARLTITLRNDAPSSGLPSIVIDSPNIPGLPAGTNATWLSIYTPLQFTGVEIGGIPSTLAAGRELGVNVFSQYVDVPADSTVTVSVQLTGRIAAGRRYSLSLRLQPMANPQSVTVRVRGSGGWALEGGRDASVWMAGKDEVQRRVFVFN